MISGLIVVRYTSLEEHSGVMLLYCVPKISPLFIFLNICQKLTIFGVEKY